MTNGRCMPGDLISDGTVDQKDKSLKDWRLYRTWYTAVPYWSGVKKADTTECSGDIKLKMTCGAAR